MAYGKKRTVLVIEDNDLNREILCEILTPGYKVLQAVNGKEGLDVLQQNKKKISLILLDIQMPVMDGYQFLDAVNEDSSLSAIPIIVTTSSASATNEIRCLEKGASDFVSKPYNMEIVLKRVKSMIRLSEASAFINRVEFDDLTGLYSKEFFYINAERMLESEPNTAYDVVCSDISGFRLVNERYGMDRGDELLIAIADAVKAGLPEDTLCGRISADTYAALVVHQEPEFYDTLAGQIDAAVKASPVPTALVHIGFYRNVERGVPVSLLVDDALLAVEEIKYQYGQTLAEYDESIKEKRVRRQEILDEIEPSIQARHFKVFYQMKYDLEKQKIGGAEALSRWIHPKLGFLSPAEFIPIFEKNGLISRLDAYVAEQTCRDLRRWIDEGRDVVPVSVNLSRADFADPKLPERIREIADRYKIPHELLHLEVTETAYTENAQSFLTLIDSLRGLGFSVELDDFGSGYSSLNVLNDLDIDVLKLDMSLVRSMDSPKQKLILEHVFRIALDFGMEVVAEGVETEEQAEELKRMGCTYAQGYYYSKPLPKEQFEPFITIRYKRPEDGKAGKCAGSKAKTGGEEAVKAEAKADSEAKPEDGTQKK